MKQQSRYHRQELFYPIGKDGQQQLLESRVAIIGIGALGSAIANNLTRAGVGYLRLIDRDIVEYSNLQRQVLFDEQDAKNMMPKSEAARQHLKQINSSISIDAKITDVNPFNIESLIEDIDLLIDGTDNLEIRYLMNEACQKHHLNWIYGGVVCSSGTTMNILPGRGPCLHCLLGTLPDQGSYDTCDTVGVISPISNIIASYETSEAIKILIGAEEISTQALTIDVWDNVAEYFDVEIDPECPVCQKHQYHMLSHLQKQYTASLCGHQAYQVTPEEDGSFSLETVLHRLQHIGQISTNQYFTTFKNNTVEFKLFPDGRAIIQNVSDSETAKRIYTDYIAKE